MNESPADNAGVSRLQLFALVVILMGTAAKYASCRAGLVVSVWAVESQVVGHLEQPQLTVPDGPLLFQPRSTARCIWFVETFHWPGDSTWPS